MKNLKMNKKNERKVRISFFFINLAWEMLVKKMEKLNLSEAEQELIK